MMSGKKLLWATWFTRNKMEFLDSNVFKLLLSSAVIVALITSVFNYLISRKTNSKLFEIESFKRKSELSTYKYTNIFEAIKEINLLPSISYNYLRKDEDGRIVQDKELFGKVVEQAAERYSKVKDIYERITPLIQSNLTTEVDRAVIEAESQSNLLTEFLYTNKPLPEGIDVSTLMQARQKAEYEISGVMKKQISILTTNG